MCKHHTGRVRVTREYPTGALQPGVPRIWKIQYLIVGAIIATPVAIIVATIFAAVAIIVASLATAVV